MGSIHWWNYITDVISGELLAAGAMARRSPVLKMYFPGFSLSGVSEFEFGRAASDGLRGSHGPFRSQFCSQM